MVLRRPNCAISGWENRTVGSIRTKMAFFCFASLIAASSAGFRAVFWRKTGP